MAIKLNETDIFSWVIWCKNNLNVNDFLKFEHSWSVWDLKGASTFFIHFFEGGIIVLDLMSFSWYQIALNTSTVFSQIRKTKEKQRDFQGTNFEVYNN